MRICIKCLSVYSTSKSVYCELCGEPTFDSASSEQPIQEAVEKIKERAIKELREQRKSHDPAPRGR